MPVKMPRIKWNERVGAAVNARRELPRLAGEFFSRVSQALEADPDAEQLHRVRLAAKQMRYTLELFRPCYGPALEARIEALRELQQILGEINDCSVARRIVANGSGPSPHQSKAERFLAGRLREKKAELRRRWTEELGTEDQRSQWVKYLARNAREPRPIKAKPA
jgi:CHAD domain-containing protein